MIQYNQLKQFGVRLIPALVIAFMTIAVAPASAQEAAPQATVEISTPPEKVSGTPTPAEYVSIHVDGGEMRQVLNSFAMQANRNIVLGPEVTNDTVTIHLNNIQWENALDVILKPYGYGYRRVGDATVIGDLSQLQALETIEPLQSRIYELNYLDANDVDGIIEGMLSPRGTHNVITAKGQKGWKDLAQKSNRSNSKSGGSLEMRTRDEEQVYSKTIVVTDVPSVLDAVTKTLAQIDNRPKQVLVEARFMEVNEDVLKDIGAQFGIGWMDGAGNGLGFNNRVFNNEPGAFDPQSQTLSGKGGTESPILTGGHTDLLSGRVYNEAASAIESLAPLYAPGGPLEGTITSFSDLTDISDYFSTQADAEIKSRAGSILDTGGQFFGLGSIDNVSMELYINLLEEDEDTETLSAPKVLTLNNQEAAIVIGTRYPIIESQFSSTSVNSVRSETLEYYESIGIQLNVVPQICSDKYIKMVVRPSVTEIIGFQGFNQFPIIKTRDTETQVLAADGETIIIGGLLEERESVGVFKVPFLGDIPFIGRLFRRDTTDTKTIDLLIFISATIVDEENYDLILEPEEAEPVVIEVASEEGVVEVEEVVTAEEIPPEEIEKVQKIMDDLQ